MLEQHSTIVAFPSVKSGCDHQVAATQLDLFGRAGASTGYVGFVRAESYSQAELFQLLASLNAKHILDVRRINAFDGRGFNSFELGEYFTRNRIDYSHVYPDESAVFRSISQPVQPIGVAELDQRWVDELTLCLPRTSVLIVFDQNNIARGHIEALRRALPAIKSFGAEIFVR